MESRKPMESHVFIKIMTYGMFSTQPDCCKAALHANAIHP